MIPRLKVLLLGYYCNFGIHLNTIIMKKTLLLLISALVSTILFAQIPETYDLRDVNGESFVTSVKSQQGGTCWTHGSLASMEGNLLMNGNWAAQGESGEPNLAEYHLDWWNGYNQYYNQDLEEPLNNGQGLEVHMGGDYRVTTAYMSRLEGAVRDMDAPSYNSPAEHYSPDYHIYYPKRVEWYNAGENLENIDLIKEKIMENGVMAICMCYDNSFINGSYNHYQPASSILEPNHSVSIIGWDDNRVTQAPNPGAWMVKNSWDTGWGYGGYFWIAYEDKQACKNPEMGAVSFIDVDILSYDTVYYHDYHGWRDTLTTASEAFNVFEANADEDIVAVSFFTAENNVDYTLKIYAEFDGVLSDERISHSGNIEFSGLHTIDLPEITSFFQGEKFYLYVEFSIGGHPYDRTSDVPVLLGGSSRTIVSSTAAENQSYYKLDGEWIDFYNYEDASGFQNTGNFCMKAIANHNLTLGVGDIKAFESGTLAVGPSPFNNTTKISIHTMRTAEVSIDIYSIGGQLIEHMQLGEFIQGEYQIDWQATNLKSGVYFISLKLDNQTVDQQKVIKID